RRTPPGRIHRGGTGGDQAGLPAPFRLRQAARGCARRSRRAHLGRCRHETHRRRRPPLEERGRRALISDFIPLRPAVAPGPFPSPMSALHIPENCGVMLLPDCTLFPHGGLPLHIFEPRYRTMLTDALEGSCLFAVARLTGPETSDPAE